MSTRTYAYDNQLRSICRLGYERELIAVLDGLVRDMDRKIERQKERASKESQPKPLTDADRAKLDDMLARQKGAQPSGCCSRMCGALFNSLRHGLCTHFARAVSAGVAATAA